MSLPQSPFLKQDWRVLSTSEGSEREFLPPTLELWGIGVSSSNDSLTQTPLQEDAAKHGLQASGNSDELPFDLGASKDSTSQYSKSASSLTSERREAMDLGDFMQALKHPPELQLFSEHGWTTGPDEPLASVETVGIQDEYLSNLRAIVRQNSRNGRNDGPLMDKA